MTDEGYLSNLLKKALPANRWSIVRFLQSGISVSWVLRAYFWHPSFCLTLTFVGFLAVSEEGGHPLLFQVSL